MYGETTGTVVPTNSKVVIIGLIWLCTTNRFYTKWPRIFISYQEGRHTSELFNNKVRVNYRMHGS